MSRSIRTMVGAGVGIAVLLAASACSSGGTSSAGGGDGLPGTIKIGVPLDLTGSAQITGVGTGEKAGIEFALKQINDAKFLGSSKVELVDYDTQADKTQAVSRTIQLTTQDRVAAIVGYSLTPSFLAAGPIAQKAGVPMMAVGLSGAGVTKTVGDYAFRTLLDYTLLFQTGDPEFVKATGAKTAAYLYGSDTVTTSGQFKARKAGLEALGVKTVSEQSITAATTDLSAQLTTIKNANPDLLVMDVDTGQVPTVLTQIGTAGIKAQILGDNGLGSAATLSNPTAAAAAQCGLLTAPWNYQSDQGGNPQFVKDWEAANGGKAPDLFNALGHDALWGMVTAIKKAGSTDGEKIRDALGNLGTFDGALGEYTWGTDGQPTYKGVMQQIQDGKAVTWTADAPACTK